MYVPMDVQVWYSFHFNTKGFFMFLLWLGWEIPTSNAVGVGHVAVVYVTA